MAWNYNFQAFFYDADGYPVCLELMKLSIDLHISKNSQWHIYYAFPEKLMGCLFKTLHFISQDRIAQMEFF